MYTLSLVKFLSHKVFLIKYFNETVCELQNDVWSCTIFPLADFFPLNFLAIFLMRYKHDDIISYGECYKILGLNFWHYIKHYGLIFWEVFMLLGFERKIEYPNKNNRGIKIYSEDLSLLTEYVWLNTLVSPYHLSI